MKQILGKLRRADSDFEMIQPGDKIAVGLSGGKDSVLLLYALKNYQRFSTNKFEICAITIDLGIEGYNPSPLIKLCEEIDVPLKIVKTQISEIIFDVRKEKNPCSLCGNMRKGALHNTAIDMGCTRIALAHHRDDVIETLLMSMFYEGRISTFSPVTHLTKTDLYLIRPFIYVTEKEIIGEVRRLGLPIVKNPCKANGFTKRQLVKDMIKNIRNDINDVDEHLMSSILNVEQLNIWDKDKIKKLSRQKK